MMKDSPYYIHLARIRGHYKLNLYNAVIMACMNVKWVIILNYFVLFRQIFFFVKYYFISFYFINDFGTVLPSIFCIYFFVFLQIFIELKREEQIHFLHIHFFLWNEEFPHTCFQTNMFGIQLWNLKQETAKYGVKYKNIYRIEEFLNVQTGNGNLF